ncbi:probable salivary secreted peptide isoform X2 [Drosophila suzukii]|uniref:Probable salivary secreted peptide isoform X2 n=1 Tax=Drosophila suzukii TaxID=28584 RepID=A0AB39ZQG5_DROSZ|nr:probable salivary secreted peptide isoform X2 [Drosophila suzukii]
MRIYVILLSVISLYALSEAAGRGPSHSVTWGVRSYRDSHLRREIITEKSRFLRVVTKDYVFDQKKLKRTITQIVITDQVRDGNGGYAYLTAGGPQSTYAKIHLKSQRNQGFSFIIDIYGI